MIRVVFVVLLFAAAVYAFFWLLERRNGGGSGGADPAKRGPLGPDDDEDFLWDLKRRRTKDGDTEPPQA